MSRSTGPRREVAPSDDAGIARPRFSPRYRTGDDALDQQILDLLEAAGDPNHRDLLFELVVSAVRMGKDNVGRGDVKLVNSAIKELRYSFHVFEPYKAVRKVTLFGSARTPVDDPDYASAREFGGAMAARDWMVMTGAGPGIMAAGIEGAGADNSFGINIMLPFEASATPFIADDPKLINFRYFFTRKLTFMKESDGYALFPGGFGTMDECFELLTLMQTGKSYLTPVVLVDPPGSTYWEHWMDFAREELLANNLISAADLSLVRIAHTTEEATDEVCRFYDTYHSMRFVGRRLVLRLEREPSSAEVAELNKEFDDILEGDIELIGATPAEVDDEDFVDLPRLSLPFDRHGFARLRQMIDRLNKHG